MANDLSPQLAIQQQINAVLVERTALYNSHTKILVTQLDLVVKIRNALKGEGLKEAEKTVRDLSTALNEATNNAESAAGGMGDAKAAIEEMGEEADKTNEKLFTGKKVFKAFTSAMGSGISTVTNVASAIFNIVASLGKLGIALLSVPFKIFDSFVQTAQTLPRNTAIVDALEEIRDVFGDIESSSGKAVASQLKTISHESSNLAGTGLSVAQVFGFGAEGIAGALKAVNELAKGTGEAFTRLKGIFKKSGVELAMMQKGLGLSAESMGKLMNLAEIRGKDVAGTMTEFAKIAIQTGKSFGIDVKAMAHGMEELNADVSTFGHLGPKAFAPMVVFAKKLGVEVKQLAGTMKKFSGFSDTAKAASELAQGFGMNIDAMKLMAEQNPAKKIDMLRKAFFRTGKDISKMTYQQKQYLAQTTGLEGTALEAAFSLDKQGISYENIEKQAKLAAKQQKTQRQVMADLGKQIKKLNKLMEVEKYSGFFDAFIKGFGVGVFKAEDMKEMLKDLRAALYKIHRAGRDIGRVFVDTFPGVKDMITALRDFFKAEEFDKFTEKIKAAFKTLFEAGPNSWEKFFEQISDIVNDQMSSGGKLYASLSKGFEKFAKFLLEGVAKAIEFGVDILSKEVLPAIQNFLDDLVKELASEKNKDKNIIEVLFGMASKSEMSTSFGKILEPLMTALQEAATKLGPQIGKIFDILWEIAIKPAIDKMIEYAAYSFAIGFAKSLLAQAAGAGLKKAGTAFFKKFVSQNAATDAINSPGTTSAIKKFGTGFKSKAGKILNSSFKGGGLATKAGIIGVGITVAAGLYNGITAGMNSPKSGSGAFQDGAQEFGATVLNTLTFGVFGKEGIKKAGESVGDSINDFFDWAADGIGGTDKFSKATAEARKKLVEADRLIKEAKEWSAKGRLNEMSTAAALLKKEYQKAVIAGSKDAQSYYAQMKATEAAYAGGFDSSDPRFKVLKEKFRREFLRVGEADAAKIIAAAEKKKLTDAEKKRVEKMATAQRMISQIEDIGSLQKKLATAVTKLDAINVDQIKKNLSAVSEKLVGALLAIPDALDETKLSAVKSEMLTKITKYSDTLNTTFKPMIKLAGTLSSLGDKFKSVETATIEISTSMRKAPFTKVTKEMPNLETMIANLEKLTFILARADLANLDPWLVGMVKLFEFDGNFRFVMRQIGQVALDMVSNEGALAASDEMINMHIIPMVKGFGKLADVLATGGIAKLNAWMPQLANLFHPNGVFRFMLGQLRQVALVLIDGSGAMAASKEMVETYMGPMIDSISGLGGVRINLKSIENVPKALTMLFDTMSNGTLIDNEGTDYGLASLSVLGTALMDISTATGKLSPKRIAQVKPVLDALANFKGGKLEVAHNLPNTKIELTVNIDSKELGKELLSVNLGPDPTKANPNTQFFVQGGGVKSEMPGSSKS